MKRKGFTLIELMIVVAIIGILAAIAIPKFQELLLKSGCNGGDKEKCRQLAEFKGRHVKAEEERVAAEKAVKDAENTDTWQTVRGKIEKVEFRPSDNTGKDRWYIVIKKGDGTIMNAMLGRPAIEGAEACIAFTPEDKWFDVLVACK